MKPIRLFATRTPRRMHSRSCLWSLCATTSWNLGPTMIRCLPATMLMLCASCGSEALISASVPTPPWIATPAATTAFLPPYSAPAESTREVSALWGSMSASVGGGGVTIAGLSLALALSFALPAPSEADAGMPGSGPGCSTTTHPSYSIVTCERTGLDRDGRLLGCSSSENCVSTSAKQPGKMGSPWEYAMQTDDADRAFASLVRAVEGAPEVTMKTIDTKGHYILAQFPSKVPPSSVDSVEFLVKPEDQIVLYRSVSRDTLFLYPLQQPVSDQGKIKERLEGIRRDLGWGMFMYQEQ